MRARLVLLTLVAVLVVAAGCGDKEGETPEATEIPQDETLVEAPTAETVRGIGRRATERPDEQRLTRDWQRAEVQFDEGDRRQGVAWRGRSSKMGGRPAGGQAGGEGPAGTTGRRGFDV